MTAATAINGAPKMGNHALWKACCLLGITTTGVQHIAHGAQIVGPHIVIKRDPRNALVSWLRFHGLPVTQGMLITHMAPYLAVIAPFVGWLADPGALVVQFERLIESDEQMREIAAHCGVDYLEDAWPNLPNHTKTWTGSLSDYTQHWTPAVESAWNDCGGAEVLAAWGY